MVVGWFRKGGDALVAMVGNDPSANSAMLGLFLPTFSKILFYVGGPNMVYLDPCLLNVYVGFMSSKIGPDS